MSAFLFCHQWETLKGLAWSSLALLENLPTLNEMWDFNHFGKIPSQQHWDHV